MNKSKALHEQPNKDRKPTEARSYFPAFVWMNGCLHFAPFTRAQVNHAVIRGKKQPEDMPKPEEMKRIRNAFKSFIPVLLAAALTAILTGCASPLGGRTLEPPVQEIDVAEVAANLAEGKAMMFSHRYQSVQPNTTTTIGNDSTLTTAAAKELIGFGAGLGAAKSTAQAVADIGNKDRLIESTLIIAESSDIRKMRESDNQALLVQGAKNVDVVNQVTIVNDNPNVQIGIETNAVGGVQTNAPEPVITNPALPPLDPLGDLDAIDIRGARLLGTHAKVDPAYAKITKQLTSADLRGGEVILDYETLGWPANNSGIGSDIDGRVYMLWYGADGKLTGGHFEWKRPGQGSKGIGNVLDGYLSGQKPPPGATVYFGLLSNDGTERTNFVQSKTPWM